MPHRPRQPTTTPFDGGGQIAVLAEPTPHAAASLHGHGVGKRMPRAMQHRRSHRIHLHPCTAIARMQWRAVGRKPGKGRPPHARTDPRGVPTRGHRLASAPPASSASSASSRDPILAHLVNKATLWEKAAVIGVWRGGLLGLQISVQQRVGFVAGVGVGGGRLGALWGSHTAVKGVGRGMRGGQFRWGWDHASCVMG